MKHKVAFIVVLRVRPGVGSTVTQPRRQKHPASYILANVLVNYGTTRDICFRLN